MKKKPMKERETKDVTLSHSPNMQKLPGWEEMQRTKREKNKDRILIHKHNKA